MNRSNFPNTSNTRMVDKTSFSGVLNDRVRMQPNRLVSLIVASVVSGRLGVFFGPSGEAVDNPELSFGEGISWVPIPVGTYEFTLVATDPFTPTFATVVLGGPSENG